MLEPEWGATEPPGARPVKGNPLVKLIVLAVSLITNYQYNPKRAWTATKSASTGCPAGRLRVEAQIAPTFRLSRRDAPKGRVTPSAYPKASCRFAACL
mgnify:CR=1 FL=1